MSRVVGRLVLVIALVCLAASVSAQQSTTSKATKHFEVIAVDGNDLVVRLPEGTKELKVPEDFRFNVDGRDLSVHELQPGMKGTATVTTTTTEIPVTVTEVKNGTVLKASGPSIIVRTDQGVKMFTQSDVDKRGVKIVRNGQPAQITDFREGDQLTATIVTTKPPRVMTERQVQATLAREQHAAGTPAVQPAGTTAPAPQATSGQAPEGTSARQLPRTASPLPLLALAGLASLAVAGSLSARRRLSR